MSEDTVRVLRIIEYVGKRSQIEKQIANSIHGERTFGYPEITIRAATIGTYPEVLENITPAPTLDVDDEIPF